MIFVVDFESHYSPRPAAINFVVDVESHYSHHPGDNFRYEHRIPLFSLPGSDSVLVDIESPYSHRLAAIMFCCGHRVPTSSVNPIFDLAKFI